MSYSPSPSVSFSQFYVTADRRAAPLAVAEMSSRHAEIIADMSKTSGQQMTQMFEAHGKHMISLAESQGRLMAEVLEKQAAVMMGSVRSATVPARDTRTHTRRNIKAQRWLPYWKALSGSHTTGT